MEQGTDMHVLMRDEKEGRSKQCQTNNKAKQHSTTKAVTFPKKNELPRACTCMYVCWYTTQDPSAEVYRDCITATQLPRHMTV